MSLLSLRILGLALMLFEIDDVSVVRQNKTILDGISVQIKPASSYAIMGSSGAGKTTLLKLFNLMTIPTSGTICYKGKDIFQYPLINYRRTIPVVFQEPALFEGTVEHNLLMPYTLKHWKQEKPSQSQLERILSLCQLNLNILHENSRVLSGGEKQRVAITRALLLKPEVLLLDEPTSALDVKTAIRIIHGILALDPKVTLIIVTHSIEILDNIDNKILIENGRITDRQ